MYAERKKLALQSVEVHLGSWRPIFDSINFATGPRGFRM
jgi:hypothetical protein